MEYQCGGKVDHLNSFLNPAHFAYEQGTPSLQPLPVHEHYTGTAQANVYPIAMPSDPELAKPFYTQRHQVLMVRVSLAFFLQFRDDHAVFGM